MESQWILTLRAFFARYGEVEEELATISKTGDFVLQVTLTRKSFEDTQRVNVLGEENARGCRRTSLLLFNRCSGTHVKSCLGKNAAPRPSQAAALVSGEVPDGEWKEMGKKGQKAPIPPTGAPVRGPTATTTQRAAGSGKLEPTAVSDHKRAATKKRGARTAASGKKLQQDKTTTRQPQKQQPQKTQQQKQRKQQLKQRCTESDMEVEEMLPS